MIIVEVDREFERFDAVLGKHSWSDFLLTPTEEEADKSSEVFFCTYHTNGEVVNGGGSLFILELKIPLIVVVGPTRRQDGGV
jgi:hypothetical protein